jgi:hypothetical protein
MCTTATFVGVLKGEMLFIIFIRGDKMRTHNMVVHSNNHQYSGIRLSK